MRWAILNIVSLSMYSLDPYVNTTFAEAVC